MFQGLKEDLKNGISKFISQTCFNLAVKARAEKEWHTK